MFRTGRPPRGASALVTSLHTVSTDAARALNSVLSVRKSDYILFEIYFYVFVRVHHLMFRLNMDRNIRRQINRQNIDHMKAAFGRRSRNIEKQIEAKLEYYGRMINKEGMGTPKFWDRAHKYILQNVLKYEEKRAIEAWVRGKDKVILLDIRENMRARAVLARIEKVALIPLLDDIEELIVRPTEQFLSGDSKTPPF